MPKEIVLDENAGREFTDGEGKGFDWDPPHLRVGWQREPGGHIQVASVHDRPPATEGVEDYGWYVSLDRAGVNALIRVLRKARDQAFGRDE